VVQEAIDGGSRSRLGQELEEMGETRWHGLTLPFSDSELAIYDAARRARADAFDWSQSALLVVDVTDSFLGARVSTLDACRQLRTACGLPAWHTLERIAELLAVARAAGRPVVYTRPARELERHMGGATAGEPAEHARADTIPDEIAPAQQDLVLPKARASAFFGTCLVTHLLRRRVTGVVVAGGTTSGCVRATVVDAMSHGFDVALPHECCFDRSPVSHAVSLFELDVKYATVFETQTACERLRAVASEARAM
jgi:nicotinamidase-related amidase